MVEPKAGNEHVEGAPRPPEKLLMANGTLRIDDVYDGVDYSAPLLPPSLELSDELEPVLAHPRQSYKAKGMRLCVLYQPGSCKLLPSSAVRLVACGLDTRQVNKRVPKAEAGWTTGRPSKHPGLVHGSLILHVCEVPMRGGELTSQRMWVFISDAVLVAALACSQACCQARGLHLVNLTKPGRLPYFECQALQLDTSDDRESWEEAYPWAIVIIVVVGCFLLITMLLGLYLYKGTEVVQKLNNLKKRMHGLPTSGPFTAVVTDIQGWTVVLPSHEVPTCSPSQTLAALCAQHPELSVKVLSIHNSILRKARWAKHGLDAGHSMGLMPGKSGGYKGLGTAGETLHGSSGLLDLSFKNPQVECK
eukprot:scaffold167073_cov18-Tisochrysis_lutea.AAC.1